MDKYRTVRHWTKRIGVWTEGTGLISNRVNKIDEHFGILWAAKIWPFCIMQLSNKIGANHGLEFCDKVEYK